MNIKKIIISLILLVVFSGCEPLTENDKKTNQSLSIDIEKQFVVPTRQVHLDVSETLYVPVYSNISLGQKATTIQLVANLSIRNTDPRNMIYILGIEYYDTTGKLVRAYLDSIHGLGPMASATVTVDVLDKAGGAGANFIVRWGAEELVNDPIVETVMIGGIGTKGISFLSRARKIEAYEE
ncbi:MAG: DUF3124 domain-containing protein [Gammaproteobacteria bacterium]